MFTRIQTKLALPFFLACIACATLAADFYVDSINGDMGFDGDTLPDILVATDVPTIIVFSGLNGTELFNHTFVATPPVDMDHHPTIADLDGNGTLGFDSGCR